MSFLFNQALQAHQSGRIAEAEALYRKIVAAEPGSFDALHLLAVVCSDTGKIQDADRFFRTALSIDPKFPPCHVNYGFYLHKQARFGEALDCFGKAIALFPNFAEAWLGRGNALRELRRYDEAFAAYARATALRPDLADAHAGCGNMLAELKRYEEAVAAYSKALALKPDLEFVAGARLHCKMRLCDWDSFAVDVQQLIAPARSQTVSVQPFESLSMPLPAPQQLDCAKYWISRKHPASDAPLWRGEIYRHDRIRIAYVSADLREHPVAYLSAGLFESHDRSRLEITAIALGPDDTSDMRRRLKGAFEHFVDAGALKDDEIASRIRNAEIDILIDLNGLTQGARTGIFARRPAPIQVNYLGYPGTMGASYIDYLIADRMLVPPSDRAYYAEKLVYLPDSYQANDAARVIAERPSSRAEFALPERGVVFCCFNNSYKITPLVFDIWMRILGRVGNSVLWLLEENAGATRNLRKEAANRGVDPQRLVFARRAPLADHLARHRLADVFLDTLPYNAHTTASDSLWAGLPVVTRIGETFAGRVAASLLNAVGLPELIVTTPQAYEDLAVKLGTNPKQLAAIRNRLERNRLTEPLFDTRGYTRHIEAAYAAMHERYQTGLPPDHIEVGRPGATVASAT